MNIDFTYDLMRSLYLSKIAKHFGIPDERRILSGDKFHIEMYRFPGNKINRYATFGLSEVQRRAGSKSGMELLFVLPAARETDRGVSEQVYGYLTELSQVLILDGCSLEIPSLLPPNQNRPWTMKATLLDEPRGESEDLSEISLGQISIHPVWAIPIYENEWEMAVSDGIEALDSVFERERVELIDIARPPAFT